ncbi:MAG TPA: bifunctional adenosylcobinamide kinase/adenosylcobinamide-phosphate guanylyltransferase [Pseudonocardiaceae bacterium]|nr:bifunctional adenosylcobinamide kinase/adenosylcobinamide-phosphate guanylyltransferase [Pseudonocardiaceae bacterium]
MTHRTLVLGGTRSGKSAYAEGLLPADQPVTYVATARSDPADDEWTARIATHVARRPSTWHTVEPAGPGALAELLTAARADDPPLLVDDLATWLTGVLDDVFAWDGDPAALAAANRHAADLVAATAVCAARLVLVSAEVGLGVVPETRSGRLFRDGLGSLNADLAATCDNVVLLVAGLPMRLKTFDEPPGEVGR